MNSPSQPLLGQVSVWLMVACRTFTGLIRDASQASSASAYTRNWPFSDQIPLCTKLPCILHAFLLKRFPGNVLRDISCRQILLREGENHHSQ